MHMPYFDTLALHAGFDPKDHGGAGAVPIYQCSAYPFKSADSAAALFQLQEFGNIYSRIMNPTQDVFEKRIAALEGGTAALATASGMAAQFLAINTIAKEGENILASEHLYGGTFNQFKVTFKRLGIEVKFFDPDQPEQINTLSDAKTRAVYLESLGNPSLVIPDFEKIAEYAHAEGLPVIVDNTISTPALFRPLEYGADIVVHSATKYIGGHGTGVGGVIVDGGKFDWSGERFPEFNQPAAGYPNIIYNEHFNKNCPLGVNIAFIIKARVEGMRDFGPSIAPFNAFLFLQGLETLSLRMQRHTENAARLTEFLEDHPKVAAVFSPSAKGFKYRALAEKYFPKGTTSLFSFELSGGREAGRHFVEAVKVALHETNLGDSRTIVTHPSTTTHQQLPPADQIRAGVTPGLVRVSAGLEDVRDLIADFEQAIG